MVKIVSRKSLGTQPVYDIGVERDHNFLLANGLVASNCFNKSHSTAYGYVSYQTAYLKANFPEEYMAALLTANSGDQDKVKKYIDCCQKMNIEVEQPDINRSGVDFTPSKGKILFGLSAIRNVGEGAVECILKAREEGGVFKSLADLCDRVNLQAVNSRALESLIKCGAFDCIDKNRNQLLKDLEFVMPWAQSRARDREIGQGNLFDLLGGMNFGQDSSSNAYEAAPKAPAATDFSSQEKLQMEKELLGFYVSDHPLKAAQKIASTLEPPAVSIADIEELKNKKNINVIVIITEIKKIITKTKGEPMAFLKVEDISGQIEAIVFPKVYAELEELLVPDSPIIIKGKAEKKEEQFQLIVDEIKPVTDDLLAATAQTLAAEKDDFEQISPVTNGQAELTLTDDNDPTVEPNRLVIIELNPQRVNQQELGNLQAILKEYSADKDSTKVPVIAIVESSKRRAEVRLGEEFWVQNHQLAVERLKSAGFIAQVQTITS